MKRPGPFPCLFVLVCASLLASGQSETAKPEPPNIILILADDAGYADFGFHGSQVMKTPHLDQLADEGIRFTQAYVSAAVCGPSRAGLLTGRYQQRFGFEENNVPGYMSESGATGEEMGLPLEETTVADRLKALGYRTALFGKWHQGHADRFHPLRRGFDEFHGFRGGARSYWELTSKDASARPENRLERGFGHYEEAPDYLTDVLADSSCSFIRENKSRPFFLILSFNAVHTPMQAKPEDADEFPGLKGRRKALAGMTLAMDRACGEVLETLKELELEENTLLVFTNDNGGPSDSNHSVNDPLSGTKANHLEGGIRVPFLMRWPRAITGERLYPFPISTLDLLPTFVAAAGGELDSSTEIDGVNLLPYLRGESEARPHPTLYWKKENRGAIRDGDWKLLRFPDRPAELYNLAEDISEVEDLAAQHPGKVRELYRKLFAWELDLERPRWQLQRLYEGKAMERMDAYRKTKD